MKKGFVKFYNVFTDIDSVYRLDMKELYVYGYLRMLQSNAGDCLVTVDFLHSIMKDSFEDNVTRNKKKIISVVHSLINKNVIKCDKDKFGNKDMLLINFNDKVLGNGHEQVESSLILNVEMYQHLYIYVTVARYQNTEKKNLECSYTEWSNLLGLHRTTTINYIEQCEKLGLIYIKQGKYTRENVQNRDQLKQEKNKYSIYPFEDNDEGIDVGEKVVVNADESDIQKAIRTFQTYEINGKGNFPKVHDYYQYLLAKENPDSDEKKKLVKVANKRMAKLNQFYMNKGLDEAQQLIDKEKQEKIQKEKEKLEQVKVDKLKNGQIIVIRDNKDVCLDSINDVQIEDKLYRLQIIDSIDGKQDFISEEYIYEIVTKKVQNADFRYYYSDDIKERLLNKFKEIYSTHDEFDVYAIGLEVEKYRKELVERVNAARRYDKAWEEDLLSMDDDRNISLNRRIQDYNE